MTVPSEAAAKKIAFCRGRQPFRPHAGSRSAGSRSPPAGKAEEVGESDASALQRCRPHSELSKQPHSESCEPLFSLVSGRQCKNKYVLFSIEFCLFLSTSQSIKYTFDLAHFHQCFFFFFFSMAESRALLRGDEAPSGHLRGCASLARWCRPQLVAWLPRSAHGRDRMFPDFYPDWMLVSYGEYQNQFPSFLVFCPCIVFALCD